MIPSVETTLSQSPTERISAALNNVEISTKENLSELRKKLNQEIYTSINSDIAQIKALFTHNPDWNTTYPSFNEQALTEFLTREYTKLNISLTALFQSAKGEIDAKSFNQDAFLIQIQSVLTLWETEKIQNWNTEFSEESLSYQEYQNAIVSSRMAAFAQTPVYTPEVARADSALQRFQETSPEVGRTKTLYEEILMEKQREIIKRVNSHHGIDDPYFAPVLSLFAKGNPSKGELESLSRESLSALWRVCKNPKTAEYETSLKDDLDKLQDKESETKKSEEIKKLWESEDHEIYQLAMREFAKIARGTLGDSPKLQEAKAVSGKEGYFVMQGLDIDYSNYQYSKNMDRLTAGNFMVYEVAGSAGMMMVLANVLVEIQRDGGIENMLTNEYIWGGAALTWASYEIVANEMIGKMTNPEQMAYLILKSSGGDDMVKYYSDKAEVDLVSAIDWGDPVDKGKNIQEVFKKINQDKEEQKKTSDQAMKDAGSSQKSPDMRDSLSREDMIKYSDKLFKKGVDHMAIINMLDGESATKNINRWNQLQTIAGNIGDNDDRLPILHQLHIHAQRIVDAGQVKVK